MTLSRIIKITLTLALCATPYVVAVTQTEPAYANRSAKDYRRDNKRAVKAVRRDRLDAAKTVRKSENRAAKAYRKNTLKQQKVAKRAWKRAN